MTPQEQARLNILRLIQRHEIKKYNSTQILALEQDGYLNHQHNLTNKGREFLRLYHGASIGTFEPEEFEGT